MRHLTILAAFGCAAMILAGAARAQESKDPTLEEARKHAAQAKVHYDLGEFEKAAEEYTEVYRIRPLPALLFNIAQSYRQAGQYEKARQFYRAYLRENPEGQTATAVKTALKEIEELLAKEKKTKDAPPAGVQPPPAEMASRPGAPVPAAPPAAAPAPAPQATKPAAASPSTSPQAVPAGPAVSQAKPAPVSALPAATVTTIHEGQSSTRRILTYSLAGASVAMLAGGAIFAIKAKNVDNELQAHPHTTSAADDLLSQSKSAHTLSLVLLGAGVASAVGAGVLYFLPTPSGAAVAGRF